MLVVHEEVNGTSSSFTTEAFVTVACRMYNEAAQFMVVMEWAKALVVDSLLL